MVLPQNVKIFQHRLRAAVSVRRGPQSRSINSLTYDVVQGNSDGAVSTKYGLVSTVSFGGTSKPIGVIGSVSRLQDKLREHTM